MNCGLLGSGNLIACHPVASMWIDPRCGRPFDFQNRLGYSTPSRNWVSCVGCVWATRFAETPRHIALHRWKGSSIDRFAVICSTGVWMKFPNHFDDKTYDRSRAVNVFLIVSLFFKELTFFWFLNILYRDCILINHKTEFWKHIFRFFSTNTLIRCKINIFFANL